MKKHILILLSVLFFASCNFLELDPLTEYSEKTVSEPTGPKYTSKEQIESLLSGTYNGFYTWYYEVYIFEFGDIMSDNSYNGTIDLPERQMETYKVSPLNTAVYNAWESLYVMIKNANEIVSNIDNIKDPALSKELKEQYLAEARALRAWAYFDLVRLFGGVPLVDKEIPEINPENFEEMKPIIYMQRATEEEIYKLIVSDLDYAMQYAPNARVGEAFVMNKSVVNGLYAKVYATQKPNWQKVKEHCDNVIAAGYSLHTDYSKIWKDENNAEIIFAVPHDGATKENVMWWLVYGGDNRHWPRYNSPSHDLIEAYNAENDNVRKNTTIEMHAVGYQINWPTMGCAFSSKIQTSDQDIVLMRLADILLLKAEALIELGDLNGATAIINQVRARVSLLPLNTANTSSKESMRLAIEKERRLELAMEGHRWFDLKRTNRSMDVLTSFKNWEGKTYEGVLEEYKLILPIPQLELDRNYNLTQNIGYK